jgi:hypothetical protein
MEPLRTRSIDWLVVVSSDIWNDSEMQSGKL